MTKRSIFTIALVLCLVALLGFASLAYFTDKDSVTNKFMTASYDPDNPDDPITPDELFSVDVTEESEDGEVRPDGGYDYKDILPGVTYDKKVTVTNTGKYDQWIRVKVTVTGNWPDGVAPTLVGIDTTKWTLHTDGYYYLKTKLAPGASEILFTDVSIPASLTTEQMAALGSFDIQIVADALQHEATGDDAITAFANCWTEPAP